MTAVLRDVTVPIGVGELALAGSLCRPEGARWAVLLISGSGPLDRDSNVPEQPLGVARALADSLAESTIASLRYDKRGVGASGGDYLHTGFDDETGDAAKALGALPELAEVAPDRVVVVGHSVGATIAIRLAAARLVSAGVVLLAAAAMPGLDVMRWQSARIAQTSRGFARFGARRFEQAQTAERRALLASTDDVIELAQGPAPARWFREYMAYDPAPDLEKIRCPVLAITGDSDVQVDPRDVRRIGELVGGPFTGATPPKLTHLLRRDPHPGIGGYLKQLQNPVDRQVLDQVVRWVEELPVT